MVEYRFKHEKHAQQDVEGALVWALERITETGRSSRPLPLSRTVNKP